MTLRARIVLLTAQGLQNKDIAQALGAVIDPMQVVEPALEQQVGDLLDHLDGVGDAA